MTKIISIGGWCGVAIELKTTTKINEISYPFDFNRTTMKGVVDLIKTDFKDFFKVTCHRENDKIGVYSNDDKFAYYTVANGDPNDPQVQTKMARRVERFKDLLSSSERLVFIRAVTGNYLNEELMYLDNFNDCLKNSYPDLEFDIHFINHSEESFQKNKDIKKLYQINNLHIWNIQTKSCENFEYTYESCYAEQYTNILNQIHNNLDDKLNNTMSDIKILKNFWTKDNFFDVFT